ncbi:DNA-binding protein [Streptomyces sp. CHD11]|uniref:DNA-binding protein n=1 Tax=Streptomyces sp. CHD11 TaxID=2741325 RepID=UPI001BFC5788|nr:DNA-binding protein [Streptomyces sp. CHD11]MBT3154324.1 DNA-binding protein [Streptomyces sp. CHD11]
MNDGTKRDMATADVEELLRAGAVLPPGTAGGGERAVPMFAQAYRHPGLDGRIVVRLTAEDHTGDQNSGFLGLRPEGDPVEIGVGQHRALGFPDWVLARHPSDGHLAMSLVEEMDKVARTVRSRAKKARATYEAIGERLAGSVPHFLPTFYEQAGRVFLAAGQGAYASQMFVNARKAETAHALPFDEARMDAVFLEFALGDAVPTKVLSSYAKGLSSRVPAATAFRHLRGLFVRLAAHGLPPSSPGATDLRRLAKAASGRNAQAEEMSYLREMLALPGTVKAPPGWWKAHRQALVQLTRQEPAARGTLLGLLPAGWEREELSQWLDLLEQSGATAGLCDSTLPAEERSPDGTAGWLRRFVALCGADGHHPAPQGLYPLVDRMAGVLRAGLEAAADTLAPPVGDVDLLDQLLSLGIPVAAPEKRRSGLALGAWAARDGRRDLLALAADSRFHEQFRRGCPDNLFGDSKRTVLTLAASPGGRPMLAAWVAEVCRRYLTSELPGHSGALRTPAWLPGEVLAIAEDEVRRALATGVAPALARTLRTGILDELGWPAWDEALEALAPEGPARSVLVADAWPHLVVLARGQARVIGAEGTVLTHELRLPDEVRKSLWQVDCHYVDGELLVAWDTYQTGSQGYWHHTADAPPLALALHGSSLTTVDGDRRHDDDMAPVTLPLPGGGRTTGGGVLRRGDTAVPGRGKILSDGTSYWVHVWDRDTRTLAWCPYDPGSDTTGAPGAPEWIATALSDAPEGSELSAAWLRPGPSAADGPVCAPVDGVLGWRVVKLPDGSRRGEDLSGRPVLVPATRDGTPRHALRFPGADRLLAVVRFWDGVELLDPDGTTVARVPKDHSSGPFTAGTVLLPPLRYWHQLQPRDPQGSAALRQVGEDTAAALLAAALEEGPRDTEGQDEPGTDLAGPGAGLVPPLVRTLLPQVGHEALRAGITGVVRLAAEQQRILDAARARLDAALAGIVEQKPRRGTGDALLEAALNGVGVTGRAWRASYYDSRQFVHALPGLLGRSMRGLAEPVPAGRTHVELDRQEPLDHLDAVALPVLPAILALRAGCEVTAPEPRAVLDEFLEEFDAQGLTDLDPGHWRCVRLRLDPGLFEGPDAIRGYTDATVLNLDGGAFLLFPDRPHFFLDDCNVDEPTGRHYGALFHDPSGRFEVPAPYALLATRPFVPEPTRPAGWAAAFRAELAEHGPAPWFPAAAEEFARLTGITATMARLVVAGLPRVDDKREPVPAATLKAIGVKTADARVAKDELKSLDASARQAVVAALLPDDPSRLWSDGPDAARAAEVWNERLGRRTSVPEDVLHEAVRTVVSPGWAPAAALWGIAGLADEPRLTRDRAWTFGSYTVEPADPRPGFDNSVLKGAVTLAAWLAHRLPSGDPVRAALPGVLTALRDRLAHPGLLLPLDRRSDWEVYRQAAGDPTETGDDFVRHGAVVLGTGRSETIPAVRTALLDASGQDPHLTALLTGERPNAQETALRLVHDRPYAELLADPGNPVAGERDADGLWWPQDPARSVPDLVTEVAEQHGIGEDAAVLYLMLLAMPDPTDRNTARWTGWGTQRGGTARLRAARAELAATDLVIEGNRSKAGRSLFLPGGWTQLTKPHLPLERWKLPMYELIEGEEPVLGVVVPLRPVAGLYRRAWQRIQDGDGPQLEELEVPRPSKRRR